MKERKPKLRAALLAFALLLQPLALAHVSAQSPQRDRKVAAPAPSSPQPRATPTAQPAQPTSTPPATPTPQVTPTPVPMPGPRTLEVLRARIAEVLARPELAPAHFGIRVVSLDTGAVLFEENAGKLLMPASNMKIYTVAAALDRLGPDFRFVTSVYAAERADAKGRLKGDLTIYGRGDPTYAARFAGEGDYFKGVEELAASIVAAGVRRVEGDLVGDESYFDGPAFGYGWEWDDLQWYYGAPISALTVNDNAVDIIVKPGASVGAAAVVTTGPAFLGFPTVFGGAGADETVAARTAAPLAVLNRATTSARGTRREITMQRPLGQAYVEVTGRIPIDDAGDTVSVTTPRPALMFVSMLRAALERRGVQIKGRTLSVDAHARETSGRPFDAARLIEIARRESAPFSEIAAKTMKPSQNLYTELILRTLGEQSQQSAATGQAGVAAAAQATGANQASATGQAGVPGQMTSPSQSSPAQPSPTPARPPASAVAGHTAVRQFLREAGVSHVEHLSLVDGSGLARQNLITAEATVELLTYMSRHRHAQVWLDAQPIAGVDGTLRGRLRGTSAAGNLRAKTGTIANVSGLSGYVTTAGGERLAFSMLVNHYTDERTPRTAFLDSIASLLASFAGRSQ